MLETFRCRTGGPIGCDLVGSKDKKRVLPIDILYIKTLDGETLLEIEANLCAILKLIRNDLNKQKRPRVSMKNEAKSCAVIYCGPPCSIMAHESA